MTRIPRYQAEEKQRRAELANEAREMFLLNPSAVETWRAWTAIGENGVRGMRAERRNGGILIRWTYYLPCRLCEKPVPLDRDPRAIYCGKRCKKAMVHRRKMGRRLSDPDRNCPGCGTPIAKGERFDKEFCGDNCKHRVYRYRRNGWPQERICVGCSEPFTTIQKYKRHCTDRCKSRSAWRRKNWSVARCVASGMIVERQNERRAA